MIINIKYLISLNMLIIFTGVPCWGASWGDDATNEKLLVASISKTGNLEEVIKALNEGANPNAMSSDNGQTALMYSALNGFKEMAIELLKRNAEINLVNNNLETALMLAVQHDRLEMVQLLLDYGADISITNINGRTALDMVKQYRLYGAGDTAMENLLTMGG